MKKILTAVMAMGMMAIIANAESMGYQYENGYVVYNGSKIGSVWCGISECTGNCLKGYKYGSSDDRFADKDRAIQGIISRCEN